MSPTAELRWAKCPQRFVDGRLTRLVLQQKWVQHHVPAGMTEAPFEWRDVPTVKEEK
jgi:hypothetical protein